jgi:F-type H+-transporting ATPase subunit a
VAITFPLVFGWLDFETVPGGLECYRAYLYFGGAIFAHMEKSRMDQWQPQAFGKLPKPMMTREVGVRRYLPKRLGRAVRLKLPLLLFAALLMSLDAGSTFGRNEAAQAGSVTSANDVAGHGNAEQASLPPAISETEEHALPQKAVEIARPFGFPITNSMVVSWIVAVGLIIFARVATRDMKDVPAGAQNLFEWLVGGLYDFLERIIGPRLVKRTFWFLATVFLFILSANWMGLIPGAGTIGWGHQTPHGFVVDQPLFRGANADLNLTLAMALVFFGCWIIWALQEVGPVGFLKELFAPKGESTGLLKVLMIIVFFAAGLLEIISILFRPISLSFRLYGNIFAGENMLETMSRLVPGLGWLLPIPFYFMELLVGLVQALVFMLLCAVFTLLMCPQKEEGSASARG